jgi:hypothetical protein
MFDTTGLKTGAGTSRIFVAVAVAEVGKENVFVSEHADTTWAAVPDQQTTLYS